MKGSIPESAFRAGATARLRDLMAARDLRPVDLARALGVSEQRVGNWLSGTAVPPPFYLYQLWELFGFPPDYVLAGIRWNLPAAISSRLAGGSATAAGETSAAD